jgi:basic membrane lipoprotein Med (substrate-binding protein (PBP1-ABC) superfamily)
VPPTTAPTAVPTKPPLKVAFVTDIGGIDDKSFNQTAWAGVERAQKELGVQGKYLQSRQQTDYDKNITTFVQEGYNLIVTVGFLLGPATAKGATDNSKVSFAIVDYTYPDCWPGAKVGTDCGSEKAIPNVRGLAFQTDEAAFLAGYLAAGMSKTGKVGTFGGLQLPTVTIFMKGFQSGVEYYNVQKKASVKVLGWDTKADKGLFTNTFTDPEKGKTAAKSLIDEGADVILPVAGLTGNGAFTAAKTAGNVYAIGVDTDQCKSVPDACPVLLTSVEKKMDNAVFDTIKALQDGKFQGGTNYVGTLKNNGVSIAPFNQLDSKIPAALKAELEQVKKDLIDGKIKTGVASLSPAPLKVAFVTDIGGIDDKSFNQTAWAGVERAQKELGVQGKYLQSRQQTDYDKNITTFVQEGYNLIVTVGFLLGPATAKGATDNSKVSFAIVDYTYPDCWPGAKVGTDCGSEKAIPNVRGLAFQTDEAAFLAGYLAAGMSKTGKVGTFGGLQLPTVTIFMKGFQSGVEYYNVQKKASVKVLGWDTKADKGLFTNTFTDPEKGKTAAKSLIDEGADVILPVAGLTGNGAFTAAKTAGNVYAIGVDTDQCKSVPDACPVLLTSVEKKMDNAVFDTIKALQDGKFQGGTNYVGTLKNNGVSIAPFNQLDSKIPAALKAELEQVKKDLIDGKIKTGVDVLK